MSSAENFTQTAEKALGGPTYGLFQVCWFTKAACCELCHDYYDIYLIALKQLSHNSWENLIMHLTIFLDAMLKAKHAG